MQFQKIRPRGPSLGAAEKQKESTFTGTEKNRRRSPVDVDVGRQ